MLADIGNAQRERQIIAVNMNQVMADIREQYEDKAIIYAQEIFDKTAALQHYMETHRQRLTHNGKTKTIKLKTGEFSWRTSPPKCVIRGVEAVIAQIREMGWDKQLLREKIEPSKEALIADAEKAAQLKGVTITQKEDFIVKPFETELEEIK